MTATVTRLRRQTSSPEDAVDHEVFIERDYKSKMSRKRQKQTILWSIFFACMVFAFYLTSTRRTQKTMLHLVPLTKDKSPQYKKYPSEKTKQAMANECSVWMAPSSLKGVNGYGIFTTRKMAAGESILGGPDGVAIPVGSYDTESDYDPHIYERRRWRDVWDNYWWGRGVPDHVAYEDSIRVMDYQIGFGCLPNHHCVLDHLNTRYPPYDDSLADRFTQPSAGAFSYNKGREFIVDHEMEAGDEIFLNYGHCSRGGSHQPDWLEHAFVTEDFNRAAMVIRGKERTGMGFDYDKKGDLIRPEGVSDLVADLLPKTKREFDQLVADVSNGEDLVRRIALSSLNRRKPEWIKKNGMCMENLFAKPSTIPLAGQGAFAQFPIKKGEIIAPAPLMQVVDKSSMDIYDDEGNKIAKQLLLNYCFGHRDTTMLLCPNTNVVLINHCSTRTQDCGPKGPNAEYRWATGWDPTTEDWRKMTVKEIAEQPGRGLAFEIVALRDIRPGEEVFIDYGSEWEKAWADHVASWQPSPKPDTWLTAKQANDNKGSILDEFVSGDIRKIVDHPHLFTGCQYWSTNMDGHRVYREKHEDWETWTDEELVETFADDGDFFGKREYANHSDGTHWPCQVIRRQKDGRYLVRILQHRDHSDQYWHENGLPRLLKNYPRKAIHYFVKPFHSDQHLKGVFRHPIGMRDELLSPQWKNIQQDEQ